MASNNSRLGPKKHKPWRTYKPGTVFRQMLCRFFDHIPLHMAICRQMARRAAKRRAKRTLLRARGKL